LNAFFDIDFFAVADGSAGRDRAGRGRAGAEPLMAPDEIRTLLTELKAADPPFRHDQLLPQSL